VETDLAPINSDLLAKIMKKLHVGRSRVYTRIDEAVRSTSLPRRVAALLVARDAGVNFSRFASEADLAMMRGVNVPHPGIQSAASAVSARTAPVAALSRERRQKSGAAQRKRTKEGNQVFVVHGRNEKVRRALFAFLRSVNVHPIEWNKALTMTRKGSPFVGEVIDAAFNKAKVIVVLFTPDDEAVLRSEFIKRGEPSFECRLTGQPRPNVLFEAGMAFGRQPNTTILVQVGKIRPISDVAGRHIVHLSNSMSSRQQLIAKLKTTGIVVDDVGEDWHTEVDFT
jgi:predicted nucleotide-binding protein